MLRVLSLSFLLSLSENLSRSLRSSSLSSEAIASPGVCLPVTVAPADTRGANGRQPQHPSTRFEQLKRNLTTNNSTIRASDEFTYEDATCAASAVIIFLFTRKVITRPRVRAMNWERCARIRSTNRVPSHRSPATRDCHKSHQ